MKSRPTSNVVRGQERMLLGLTLGVLLVLAVWLLAGNLDGQVSQAAAADAFTGGTVATVPTDPTVATVATLPTDVTGTTTATAEPTTTPTVTPIPSGDDRKLDPITPGVYTGNYCMALGGVGLTTSSSGTFMVNIQGTAVAAYLVWSGRYLSSQGGDNAIEVAVNSDPAVTITGIDNREAFSGWVNHSHYTYRSENLVNSSLANALTGVVQFTVSGLHSGGTESDQGHGVGLIVIYENEADCPITQINPFFGLDGFHHRFAPPAGPNSEVVCVTMAAAAEARQMEVRFFVGGAEGSRPNAVWAQTGTGVKPTDLVNNGTAVKIAGSDSGGGTPALTANQGPQWDLFESSITVPAGATYACFQIESVDPNVANGASGVTGPIDVTQDTVPYGTSGLWVSMITRLLPGSGGLEPTATATATATATKTATAVINTPTPTATKTATAVINTPTPTATKTATAVVNTPMPTATATQVASCTPKITITITSHPSPAHPGRPLVYLIRIKVTEDCGIRGLRLHATIPFFTIYNGGTQSAALLENAGWQCPATTGGSVCDYTIGDMVAGAESNVEFPVTVSNTVPLGTDLTLKVTAEDANGNSQTGTTGVNYDVKIEAFELLLPIVNNP